MSSGGEDQTFTLGLMSPSRKFEEQLAALDALRQQPREAVVEPLRKALANRNNFIAAKAAKLISEFGLNQLTTDLLTAFDRFFEDPVKTDPQCWAKNAVSAALAQFDHSDAKLFLRGMKHIQLEPSFGGSSDSAGTLRATCALGLVQCRSLREPELLTHLLELMNDAEKFVRVEAIRAIEQVNSTAAALLLRQRAILSPLLSPRLQEDEPEALGACFGAILGIEGASAIPWVARFLAHGDDAAAEAALAIAGTRSPQAFEILRERFNHTRDPWFSSVLLSAIALTRQEASVEFLFDQVRSDSAHSEPAIEAILRSAPAEVIDKLKKLVAGNPRLSRAFAKGIPSK